MTIVFLVELVFIMHMHVRGKVLYMYILCAAINKDIAAVLFRGMLCVGSTRLCMYFILSSYLSSSVRPRKNSLSLLLLLLDSFDRLWPPARYSLG